MLATSNSGPAKPRLGRFLRRPGPVLLAGMMALVAGFDARAQVDPTPPASAESAGHAEKVYEAARARFNSETNNPEITRQFARACSDWADRVSSDGKRATIASEGITASLKLLAADSNSVPGHYYLALNLGELARTKSLGALKIVGQMEEEFQTVARLDPAYEYAGADRGLGQIYLETPGWPVSIGGKGKARQHLQQALKLASGYPDNHLNLIEADLKWGDKKAAAAGLKALDEIWPAARKQLTGDDWASAWSDWEKRRADAQKKAGVPATPPPAKK